MLNEIIIPLLEKLDKIESLIRKNTHGEQKLMTVKDVASYTHLSQITIRRNVMKGCLKPFKEDGKKLFRRVDVDRWLKG